MTTPELIASYAAQIRSFLGTEAATAVFAEIDQRYFAEFKAAATDDARREAWAKSQALADVRRSLQAVVDAAEFDAHTAQQRAKAATG